MPIISIRTFRGTRRASYLCPFAVLVGEELTGLVYPRVCRRRCSRADGPGVLGGLPTLSGKLVWVTRSSDVQLPDFLAQSEHVLHSPACLSVLQAQGRLLVTVAGGMCSSRLLGPTWL